MAGLREILQRGLQTERSDFVSLFGDDLLRLILEDIVCVGFSVYLGALVGCEQVDSEVVQFEELEFLRQLLLARNEVVSAQCTFGLLAFDSVGDRLLFDLWKGVKRCHLANELLELILYLGEVLVD